MPTKTATARAQKDRKAGRSPSTQAGEFVHDEIEHIRDGTHGARSARQAIAIGLSKARRAGVPLPPPQAGTTSTRTRRQASRDLAAGRSTRTKPRSPARSKAMRQRLQREGRAAASTTALSRHARASARRRSAADRSAAARKGARTKGAERRSDAATQAARTRAKKR